MGSNLRQESLRFKSTASAPTVRVGGLDICAGSGCAMRSSRVAMNPKLKYL